MIENIITGEYDKMKKTTWKQLIQKTGKYNVKLTWAVHVPLGLQTRKFEENP